MKRGIIQDALGAIAEEHGGILRPADVVDAAAAAAHPLHACFEWDDARAGQDYRLWQARKLIAVVVCGVTGTAKEIRAFVSLKTDRTKDGGGYRILADVMTDKQMREQMLDEALEELQVFQTKYRRLKALAPIWPAVRRVMLRRSA